MTIVSTIDIAGRKEGGKLCMHRWMNRGVNMWVDGQAKTDG